MKKKTKKDEKYKCSGTMNEPNAVTHHSAFAIHCPMKIVYVFELLPAEAISTDRTEYVKFLGGVYLKWENV